MSGLPQENTWEDIEGTATQKAKMLNFLSDFGSHIY